MRLAKWPYAAFQENMKKAKGLAVAQQYLNEFIEKGPDEFMQSALGEAMGLIKDILGFDVMGFTRDAIQGPLKAAVEQELAKRLPKEMPKVDEATAVNAARRLEKLVDPLSSVLTLKGQTLLEQAIVLGVTAFETYITDIVSSTIRLNPTLVERFTPELQKRLDWVQIKKHGKDWKEAATTIILETHPAFDLRKVRTLFERLVNLENAFGNEGLEKSILKFLVHRHLIVHRAGKVDRAFQEAPGSRQARGTTVELTTTYVTEGLEALSLFAAGVQGKLQGQATDTESSPPE